MDERETGNDQVRKPRRAVALRGLAIFSDSSRFPISIINLSYDGCRIEAPLPLIPDTKLKLLIFDISGQIDAVVRWCADGNAGLQFNVEHKEQPKTPRQHERISVSADILLRRAGRPGYRVRVFDLTPAGCRVEFVERPAVGDRLWFKLDFLDALEGTVRWVDGHYGGLEFERPIVKPVFDFIMAQLKA